MADREIADDGGAAYVCLRPPAPIARTESMPDGINLDYDAEGNVIGIEVMHLTSVDCAAAPVGGMYDNIASEMPALSHLQCMECGRRRRVGEVAGKLRNGWPTCCGYTMRLFTVREVETAAAGVEG